MARKRRPLNHGLTAKHLGDVDDHADHASIGQGKGPPGPRGGPHSRGKGGGKPALAQGQGSNVAAIGEAQTEIAEHLQAKLGVEASAISTVVGLAEVATPAAAETAAAPAAASSTAPIDAKTAASLSSEEYLARFDLQANLEKMVNKILQDKPANPYTAMADYLSSLPK